MSLLGGKAELRHNGQDLGSIGFLALEERRQQLQELESRLEVALEVVNACLQGHGPQNLDELDVRVGGAGLVQQLAGVRDCRMVGLQELRA